MTNNVNIGHMCDRLQALAFLGGQRSERATLRYLKDNGYTGDATIDDVLERAREYGFEIGLSLTLNKPGDESEDTDRVSTYDPYDKTTWPKALYRVPRQFAGACIWDYCLSCGGPEDGFLIVADYRGRPVAGYYYEADWGTFARRRLTDRQLQSVAEFLSLEDMN